MEGLLNFGLMWAEYKAILKAEFEEVRPPQPTPEDDHPTAKAKRVDLQDYQRAYKAKMKLEQDLLRTTIANHNLAYLLKWIDEHQARPYFHNPGERKLAKLYLKNRASLQEKLKSIPRNMVKEYREYTYRFGHPSRTFPAGGLVRWRNKVRAQYRDGVLPAEDINEINSILGPTFLTYTRPAESSAADQSDPPVPTAPSAPNT